MRTRGIVTTTWLLGAALLSATGGTPATAQMPTTSAPTETGSSAPVRPYENGSGPAAIFRLGRIEAQHRDVFGIIDPIEWRIRYYTLDDWSLDAGAPSFSDRWVERASCALSPSFRIWRIHNFPDAVVLQSQPHVPVKALIWNPGETAANLDFAKLKLPADAATLATIASGTPTDIHDIPRECGTKASPDSMPRFTKADAAAVIEGGGDKPFRISRVPAARQTAFDAEVFRFSYQGRSLSSLQELEQGLSLVGKVPIRHFLLTTRTLQAGFVTTETVLIRKSPSASLEGHMTINLGLNRVKLGQRPVAVSSRGEVLILGAPDKNGFRVQQCNFVMPCQIAESTLGASEEQPPEPRAGNGGEINSPVKMWRTAFAYTDREFRIDLRNMPENCRGLVSPCRVSGLDWVPLPELRGASGDFVTHKGMPYGQVSGDPPSIAADAVSPGLGLTLANQANPSGLADGLPAFFGDIYNAGDIKLPSKASVFGIDCSALVSVLWNVGWRWDTGNFITYASEHSHDIARVREMAATHTGDAFVINIAEHPGDPFINHIAVFVGQRDAGPADSSRAMLVVESNASCGGACWSVYDESFFNGWAILRHSNERNDPAITTSIPTTVTDWRSRFAVLR